MVSSTGEATNKVLAFVQRKDQRRLKLVIILLAKPDEKDNRAVFVTNRIQKPK